MHYISTYDSPLGGITLASDGNRLTGLWFQGQKYYADTLPEAFDEKPLPCLTRFIAGWTSIFLGGYPILCRRWRLPVPPFAWQFGPS